MHMALLRAIFLVLLLSPMVAFAGFIPVPQVSIGILPTPDYPKPHSTITLRAETYGAVGDYAYRWTVDGAPAQEGVNARALSVSTGPIGSSKEVGLQLIEAGGAVRGSATFIIHPADVDIIWEAETYVPPFYRGRRLPHAGSNIVLTAIPFLTSDISDESARAYSYQWRLDAKPLASQSGIGRSTISVSPPFFNNTFTVTVLVSTANGSLAAEKTVSITPVQPLVLAYELNPLLGLLTHRAVQQTVSLVDEEVTLLAMPLFVADPEALTYVWRLHGSDIQGNADNPRITTLRRTGGVHGIFPVGVSFFNPRNSQEAASSVFDLSL